MADAGSLAAALAEIREREQRATPGPWKAETDRGLDLDGDGWDIQAVNGPDGEPILLTMVDHPNKGDARFAAAARSDVPRLLAAVEAALEVHALTALHRHTEACPRHHGGAWRQECPDCKVIEWTGCETCRDEFGNPARAEDCTTRQAITRALLGEEFPDGS